MDNLLKLLDESIMLELNMSELYVLFSGIFPEDRNFWWRLSLEEKNHAALLKSGKEYFVPNDKFPSELLDFNIENIMTVNAQIRKYIEMYAAVKPERSEAFSLAYAFENSASELHFQEGITGENVSSNLAIFQALNKDDKDHAERIEFYMKEKGIEKIDVK